MIFMRICISVLSLLPAFLYAASYGNLSKAVTYYQGCESLTSRFDGEEVHPFPALFPGKVGHAFRMEQRFALNHLRDPDFDEGLGVNWLAVGQPLWRQSGGSASEACFQVDGENYIRQAIVDLDPERLQCFSVYAKSETGGELVLEIKSGSQCFAEQFATLTNEYQRFALPFVTSDTTAATVSIRAADARNIIVDAAQLEPGRSWPRSFNPKTRKALNPEWIDIPAKALNPAQGSVAFWFQPHWLAGRSESGMAFFSARANVTDQQEKPSRIVIGAYRRLGRRGWENGLYVSLVDADGQSHGYCPVEWDRLELDAEEWHHIAVTWEFKQEEKSSSSTYLNGKLQGSTSFVSRGMEAPETVIMGYSAGAYADCLMDEFYLFNRQLSNSEVRILFALRQPLL